MYMMQYLFVNSIISGSSTAQYQYYCRSTAANVFTEYKERVGLSLFRDSRHVIVCFVFLFRCCFQSRTDGTLLKVYRFIQNADFRPIGYITCVCLRVCARVCYNPYIFTSY